MKNVRVTLMKYLFLLCACVSILAVILICVFLFKIENDKLISKINTNSTTAVAIRAVPNSYYEGSLALGATHERSVFFTVLPAAKSGILAGVILGIGRAIGETMAVIMIAGNQPRMPKGLFKGVRTLTSNIVMEM